MADNNYFQDLDIAMLYRGEKPHPAHRGFAEAVNADLIGLDRISLKLDALHHSIPEELVNGVLAPSYDVYIAEGTRALYGALARQIGRDSTLIYLAGDQAIFKLTEESYELNSPLNRFIKNHGLNAMQYIFNRYIDGVIAVSDFSAEYTARILSDKPMRVANPYIQPDLYDLLGTFEPTLDRNIAITVGACADYKGQDILVEAWESVREEHPDAELRLVGTGYPDQFDSISGVQKMGYVEDLPKTLAEASLYVQPSRADNYPVSVLEAMRLGLPAVVTTTTGTKAEVVNFGDEFVADARQLTLADAISAYFDHPLDERQHLSQKAVEIGSTYDEDTCTERFRNEFEALLSDLGLSTAE